MKKGFILSALLLGLISCNQDTKEHRKVKSHYPSKRYEYVSINPNTLPIKKQAYLPIYSNIYSKSGKQRTFLTATLSIRNISFTDTFYVSKVDYYDSHGALLRKYLDSVILVSPMNSIEFVVEESETKGGAGANFVVHWGAYRLSNEPFIQGVMTGGNFGISFTTNSVTIQ